MTQMTIEEAISLIVDRLEAQRLAFFNLAVMLEDLGALPRSALAFSLEETAALGEHGEAVGSELMELALILNSDIEDPPPRVELRLVKGGRAADDKERDDF